MMETAMTKNADTLEARILADLRPVRPLARPWKRGLAVCGVAALLAAVVMLRFGLRVDAPALGPGVLWGLSALEAGLGLLLVAAALRESVPGRRLAPGWAPLLLLAGISLAVTVTFITWSVHAREVPAGKTMAYWAVCFKTPTLVGLPSLIVTLLLAFRAYPTRPALVGALAGLGAGLLADGSWRTYCEVTAPVHVLSAHVASVLLLGVLGLALGAGAGRLRK